MDKDTFFNLLDKYQDGSANAAEKQLIEEYFRRLEAMKPTKLSVPEMAAMKETMYGQIMSTIAGTKSETVPFRNRIFIRVTAAAVTIGLLVSGYFLLTPEPPRDVKASLLQENQIKNDLPPGRNAAILTLAGGKQILLDSASGTIGNQGGATVVNLNGRLTYSSSKERSNEEVIYHTITTARGNQYQLVLADGSKVWLNSASSLRFPATFTDDERKVELTGEAYFEIAPLTLKGTQERLAFIVSILPSAGGIRQGPMDIHVLGTHFNVNAYADETSIKTTLLEGSVRITNDNTDELPMKNHKLEATLKAGQQAQLKGNEILIEKHADIEKEMAWKSGFFEFDKTDLATIMRQISRWYNVDVVYEGKLTDEKFGGRISKNLNLSGVLRLLETNGVKFRLEGAKLIVQL